MHSVKLEEEAVVTAVSDVTAVTCDGLSHSSKKLITFCVAFMAHTLEASV